MLAGRHQLAAWTLSGMDTQQKAFQQKLHSYCSLDGARAPTQYTRVLGRSGSDGVCHRKWIPFRALSILRNSWTLFSEGLQYRSINTIRSAVSMTHNQMEGVPLGQHPLVSRLFKGMYNSRSPQP